MFSAAELSVEGGTTASVAQGAFDSGSHASTTPSREISGATVLVTDEHYKHSLGIVRHLGKMGARVCVVASTKDALVCSSRYCERVFLSRGSSVDALVETVLEVVQENHFDVVIPVSYSMTRALARKREQLLVHSHLELASSDAIERAANKAEMVELARSVGVPAPKSFVPSALSELLIRSRELQFPVVVKPRKESPGHPPVRYAKNGEELRAFFSDKNGSEPFSDADPPLIQEFIPGYGCGFFATYQDGQCKRTFMHRRIREYPASGGSSTCAESFYDPQLEASGKRLLNELQWHGVAMVEFRRDSRDGSFKLIEINPKFWGSLDLALAAGADFPGDLCRMALGHTLTSTTEYQQNLRYHWPFATSGELFHLWNRPSSLFQCAFDLINPGVKSNVWLRDFGPNHREILSLGRTLFGRKRR
jgi:predicted ATP-grasp superfamily ATP-dependent carboligase